MLLEHLPAAALVTDRGDATVHANSAARALLDSSAEARDRFRAAVACPAAAVPVRLRGAPELRLLLASASPGPATDARLAGARRRWSLTPRQLAVLRELVSGADNATIADRLRVSRGAVELHVGALLARAGAGTRSELIARFYTAL